MFDIDDGWDAGGGAAAGGPPARRQMMRQAEVKGKLARFLAGMRAYERQQTVLRTQHGSVDSRQELPPVLSDFIAWAGDVLAGEQQGVHHGNGGLGGNPGGSRVQEVARRYVAGSGAALLHGGEEEEEHCCICLEVLRDVALYDVLGEPLKTACGHHFHAVCYAKTMETSQQEPTCPICRSHLFGNLRFLQLDRI